MEKVQLIITCEDCGSVKHFNLIDEDQVEPLLHNFSLDHPKCKRKFLSYITIGEIKFNNNDENEQVHT